LRTLRADGGWHFRRQAPFRWEVLDYFVTVGAWSSRSTARRA
jgi:hypothetical protein